MRALLTVLLLLSSSLAAVQDLRTLVAQRPSPAQIAAVDAMLHEIDQPGMPGCSIGVVEGGNLVLTRSYGLADVENGVAIDSSTRFDIGSMSKQFLAMAVLILTEKHILSLDEDVHSYVPELPPYQWKVSLRELLHHTSGLKDYDQLLQLAGWRDGDLKSPDDVLWIVKRQKDLAFRPGTQYMYSDTNYFLLGLIAQRVTGKHLDDLLKEIVFAPLGMTSTSLRTDRWALIPHKAWPYAIVGGKPQLFMNAEEPLGDGGIFTTTGDLALWERNFDHPVVGGATIIAEMLKTVPLKDNSINEYASGLYVRSYNGSTMVEHSGTSYGYQADKMYFPADHLSVIVLCNRRDGSYVSVSNRLAEILLEKVPTAPKVAATGPSQDQLARFAGLYFSESAADAVLIEAVDGGLIDNGRQFRQTGPFTFDSTSEGTLCRCSTTYTFQLSANGMIEGFNASRPMGAQGTKTTIASYKRMGAAGARQDLAEFAGDYVSDDVASSWCIIPNGNALLLRRRGFGDHAINLLWNDALEGPGGVLQFERDGDRISGFQLRNSRINSISFRKLAAGVHPVPAPYACPEAFSRANE